MRSSLQPHRHLVGRERMKRKRGTTAGLFVGGFHGHRGRVGLKVERQCREACQFVGSQSGHRGQRVEGRSIRTRQPSEVLLTIFGGVDQPGEFLGFQRSPLDTDIDLAIELGQVSKRIPLQSASLHQPVAERLHRAEMMIARCHSQPTIAALFEPVCHLVRIELSQQLEATAREYSLAPCHRQCDVLTAVSLRFEVLPEVGNMIGEWLPA